MSPSAEPPPERDDDRVAPGTPALFRLLCWLSPSFPTGAFSYSHGLEAAAAAADVRDRRSLEAWIAAIIAEGSGRLDADILIEAYRATLTGDTAGLRRAHCRGAAYRATAELALESAQQGEAFAATCRAAWANPCSPPIGGRGEGAESCHAAAFGAAAAAAAIALTDALTGYLQAFAGNLVSAGLRLGIIGQTDGQRILAALEPLLAAAVRAALARDVEDFGSATFALDIASMAHETQYSRLFRS